MTIQSSNRHSLFSHPSIGDGYLAAIMLLSLPFWAPFFGELAAIYIDPHYRFPVKAVTAALLYAGAVHLALSAWQKPGVGSRSASVFSLVVALLLPLFLRTLLA